MAFFAITMSAYDFEAANGDEVTLYYNINEDGNSVSLVQGPQKYSTYYIVIPETVKNHGKTYIVTTIGTKAFQDCGPLEVHMPNSVIEIQNYAFNHCSLANITFSKSLKHIGRYAFERTNFNSQSFYPVELPEGLETIGESAFRSTNLVKLNVPESVTSIDSYAFAYCASLAEISLPKNLKNLKEYTFFDCMQLKTIVLPENLEYIGESVFNSSSTGGLEEITFPATLTEIGASAFRSTQLVKVVLPDNITKLGNSVFSSCRKLEEITFSKGMTEIPIGCVSSCSRLFKVTIPNSITKIGDRAFAECSSLSSISLPESLTDVGTYVFLKTAITSTIKLPSNLTYIGEGMFQNCSYMTTFTIPNTIKEIKRSAFHQCENLSQIVIPKSVTELGVQIFQSCYSLKEVTIPTSITSISASCFYDCKGLQKVNFHDKLLSIGRYAFRGCENLTNVQFPKNIKEIIEYAFSYCTSLQDVTLPSSLEHLGDCAFEYCPNMNKLHINRAIPPFVLGAQRTGEVYGVVESGSECVLYVPKGGKPTYMELIDTQYKNFVDIIEEDVDGTVVYQIRGASTDGKGMILVNGKNLNEIYEIDMRKEAVLTIEPNDGYRLKSLIVNDIDVTAQVKDNHYVIESVLQNYTVKAEFTENPVNLDISTGNGVYVGIGVEKYISCECRIEVEDGWKLNTVLFNGKDVTADVINGIYRIAGLTANATFVVSVEKDTPTGGKTSDVGSHLKAWATGDGILHVEGLEKGNRFEIYNAEGKQINLCISDGNHQQIPLPSHGIYIVRTPQKIVKLNY